MHPKSGWWWLVLAVALAMGCGGDEEEATGQEEWAMESQSQGMESPPPPEPTPAQEPEPQPEPEPPPPAAAKVRVVHASPDRATANVSIYMDGSQTPGVTGLAFKAGVPYMDVPAGQHTAAVRPAAAAADAPPLVETQTPTFEGGHWYTVVAHGMTRGEPALALTGAEDLAAAPAAGKARIRFFHGLVGADAVDICTPGENARAPGTPVHANVAYGQFSSGEGLGYAEVASGAEVVLQIRQHNDTVCSGRVLGVVHITPTDATNHTAVALGRSRGAPRKELVLCSDAPSSTVSCTSVPIAAR